MHDNIESLVWLHTWENWRLQNKQIIIQTAYNTINTIQTYYNTKILQYKDISIQTYYKTNILQYKQITIQTYYNTNGL